MENIFPYLYKKIKLIKIIIIKLLTIRLHEFENVLNIYIYTISNTTMC